MLPFFPLSVSFLLLSFREGEVWRGPTLVLSHYLPQPIESIKTIVYQLSLPDLLFKKEKEEHGKLVE